MTRRSPSGSGCPAGGFCNTVLACVLTRALEWTRPNAERLVMETGLGWDTAGGDSGPRTAPRSRHCGAPAPARPGGRLRHAGPSRPTARPRSRAGAGFRRVCARPRGHRACQNLLGVGGHSCRERGCSRRAARGCPCQHRAGVKSQAEYPQGHREVAGRDYARPVLQQAPFEQEPPSMMRRKVSP